MATVLAKRVDALEKELAELKRLLHGGGFGLRTEAPGPDDWKSNFGRFKDDPTYDEAARLGRAYRKRQPKC